MTDDDEFARIVAHEWGGVRETIRSGLLRDLAQAVAVLLAGAAVIVLGAVALVGWAKAGVICAIVLPLDAAYGWWLWRRKMTRRR